MLKQLIVNADDFGRSPGANRGILEAHTRGIVSSTTVLINYPSAAAGLDQAQREAPRLGLGLHLNLTSGIPVSAPSAVPSLLDPDGRFWHISVWAQHVSDFQTEHIQRELAAQVARFVELTGRPPDHLDAHHHATYVHPAALQAMLEFARGYHIPMRHGLLQPDAHQAVGVVREVIPGIADTQAFRLAEGLTEVLNAQPEPPFWPAHFERGFYDRTATLADLLVILTNLPADSLTELMCHPAYVDQELASSPYAQPRERELRHLTHPAVRECLQAEFIALRSFGDVPRPAAGQPDP